MKKYQVVGIGNAVVDVIATADDAFLDRMNIEKGIMQLIDRDRGDILYSEMKDRTQAPGGAVANTLAGLGALGVRTAFIGRVCDDSLGEFYARSMQKNGTDFVNSPIEGGELPTSRSMIFISPDGDRSMNTYLGISAELGTDDVPTEVGLQAELVFLEGYLFDKDKGKEAFKLLARKCRSAGGRAGIAISDPFCVERHRSDFLTLIEHELDFVIGNEDEVKSLFQTDKLDKGLEKISAICDLVVCTRGGDGVSVISKGQRTDVSVERIVPVDLTGAGDQFAAGFLFGLINDRDIATCCKIGAVAAGEVIGHIGPRPQEDVKKLIEDLGL
ncbi:MAG: adenosine kinase [Aestuariivita sp.]|nr:adenosine kinase [Aestuariivita sp.]